MILVRVGDKEQNKMVNMAEIAFFWGGGVSEIQCSIFQQNNVNPYGINNNYIELSIDFHNMIFFLRRWENLISASNISDFMHN